MHRWAQPCIVQKRQNGKYAGCRCVDSGRAMCQMGIQIHVRKGAGLKGFSAHWTALWLSAVQCAAKRDHSFVNTGVTAWILPPSYVRLGHINFFPRKKIRPANGMLPFVKLLWPIVIITTRADETEFLPVQRRSRFILSYPTLWGQRCPDLHETRPCMDLMRCRTYRWQITDWSQCMFHSHQDKCGTGYRARGIFIMISNRPLYLLSHAPSKIFFYGYIGLFSFVFFSA